MLTFLCSIIIRCVLATFFAIRNTVASLENFDKETMDSDSSNEEVAAPSVLIDNSILLTSRTLKSDKDREMMDSDSGNEEIATPSVFIDNRILLPSRTLKSNKDRQAYLIHDDIFLDNETMAEKYFEFEFYGTRVTDENGNDEKFSDEGADDKEYLRTTIHKVPNGVIINSNVFLTDNQWHTIMSDNINMMHCFACNMYSDIRMSTGHMQSEEHLCKLARYKPLAKFDLSIIRKIRNQYHCGVCNEMYELYEKHKESHTHQNNLLFAINKVSDIINDLGINVNRNNDSCNFNANNINNRNSDGSSVNGSVENENDINEYCNEYEYENNEFVDPNSSTSYANMLKKAKADVLPKYLEKDLGNTKVQVKFDSWHMIICPKYYEFYCMVCKVHMTDKGEHCNEKSHLDRLDKCKIVDAYKDYLIRQVDDTFYHCGLCNNLHWVHCLDSHIETKHQKPNKTVSESSSLSNNDNDNCANKETITETKVNTSANSNDKLTNNIEDKNYMPNHDVSKNTVNASKNTVNASKNTVNDSKNTVNDNKNTVNDNKNTLNDSKNSANDNLHNSTVTNNNVSVNRIMSENMNLNIFGLNIEVPVLAYNVVCRRSTDFYCGLCNVAFSEDMILNHIYALPHIQCMQWTPFIIPFNCNLIRPIRDFLHCAICNTAVNAGHIYIHIQDPLHRMLLSNALKLNPMGLPFNNQSTINGNDVVNPQPVIKTNIRQENKNDGQTELMKVENPKKQNIKKKRSVKHKTELMTNGPSETELMKVKSEEKQEINTESPKTDLMTNDTSETESMLDDSLESIHDFESYIYVKIINVYYRITLSSYNTLVHVGDGSRYCFVCAIKVNDSDLSKHIDNRTHMENLGLCKFLDKPNSLLRQMHLTYHCSSCNVLVSRKHLNLHSTWPTHIQEFKSTYTSRKIRKVDIRNGVPNVKLDVQKEILYLNDNEPEVKIVFKVKIIDNEIKKYMKIVIVSGDVLKVAWENWNGICTSKNGLKCIICSKNVNDVGHVLEDEHEKNLQIEIKRKYLPDLFREINNVLHCIVCNLEVANNDYTLKQHIEGKKHTKAVEDLHLFSSHTNHYNDCMKEVLNL